MAPLVTVLSTLVVAIGLSQATMAVQAPANTSSQVSNSQLPDLADLRKKAEAGDSSAAFELGHDFEKGTGVQQSSEQAAFWYRKAAEQGNAKAQSSLGVLYWLGEGVEKNKEQAVEWYRKAARQGDASAMFNLGVAYYNGEGVAGNEVMAHAWFILASEAGSSAATDAAKRSQSEHPDSYADACLAIGQMYEQGDDLPADMGKTMNWYQKAAQTHSGISSGEAAFRLANLYLRVGNYIGARPWCEAVANAHNLGGAYCLGRLYHDGLGVTQDLKTSLKWYEQDASRGHIAAMFALGRMYEKGEGSKVDRAEAMNWLVRAGAGNPRSNDAAAESRKAKDATAEARKLRDSMSEAEWKTTRKKLKDYHLDPDKVEAFLRADNTQASH